MAESPDSVSRANQALAEAEETLVDPHALWKQERARCPIHMPQRAEVLVRRRDHIEQVLRDEQTFSTRQLLEQLGPYMGPVILGMDGRRHTRYRNLVSHAFRRSALERWEKTLIRPTLDRLLEGIAPRGRAELVSELTSPFPTQVIAAIMGVPVEDHAQLHRWAIAINSGPFHPEAGLAASRAMRAYLEPIIADRRRAPSRDLISDIVHARVDGEQLDEEHVYGFLLLLIPAGAETTYREFGHLLGALLGQPAALERVRTERARIPHVIEETLRWESSAPLVSRVATRDTEIGGCPIPEGTRVAMSLGSANRDERVYERADDWDPEREIEPPHLAFGWGRHVCIGMHLARLELRVGLEAVLDHLPGLRLDPDMPPPRTRGVAFRGPESIHVRFEPRRPASGGHNA